MYVYKQHMLHWKRLRRLCTVRSMLMIMADMSNMAVERWLLDHKEDASLTFDDPFGRWQLILRRSHRLSCAHEISQAVPSMARNYCDFLSITPYLSPWYSFKMAFTTQHLHRLNVYCALLCATFYCRGIPTLIDWSRRTGKPPTQLQR